MSNEPATINSVMKDTLDTVCLALFNNKIKEWEDFNVFIW